MKNIKIVIAVLLIGFIGAGCDEDAFLEEAPVSAISTLTFFQNEEHFKQSVNAAYTDLRTLAGSSLNYEGGFWAFGEMRSDNSTYQLNEVDQSGHRFWHLNDFLMDSGNEILSPNWNACYQGIGKSNVVLEYIEDVEVPNKEQYIGEVRFLRALYYFFLVRHWGDVPLVVRTAKTYQEAFEMNKRAPSSMVYDLIIEDLNYAKQVLPLSHTGNNLGRATSGAARTLLAKVLMYNHRYTEAIPELTAVIGSGQYQILPDYASVFDINNENNDEIVFSVQFITGPFGLHGENMYRFTPWNSTDILPHPQVTARTGMNIPTQDLINSFEEGDLRLNMIDTTYIDEQYGTYRGNIVPYTKKQWDPGHVQHRQAGHDFPLMRYPLVLLKLAECYLRDGGGDPVPLVNQVRERAGLPALSSVTLEDIIHERRVEFHCEADRWDVLVRTGIVNEVMTAHGQRERANRPMAIGPTAFQRIKILYPIPAAVISNDPTLPQNPEHQ